MHTHLSRADLLKSSPLYDKHRDGPDTLPMGEHRDLHTYTGPNRNIAIITQDREREMFLMRTQPQTFPAWMRNVREDARLRVATHADKYDWDCHKCGTSVMTDTLADTCPNCLL